MGFWDTVLTVFTALSAALTPLIAAQPWLLVAILAVAIIAGVIDKNMSKKDVQDLGDKALQCDKKLEDFDNFDDYFKYVDQVKLDPEKSKLTTDEQKVGEGASLLLKGVEEKMGIKIGADFIKTIASDPKYFEAGNKLLSYFQAAKETGFNLDKIQHYNENKLTSIAEKNEVTDFVKKADSLTVDKGFANKFDELKKLHNL